MIIGIDASRATAGQRTGTEAYAYHLIRSLIPMASARGHELRLYFNQPPQEDLFDEWCDARRVVITRRRLWTHWALGRELRRRPPDVFFTPAHVIPIGYRGAAVATIHDLGYEYFPEAHPRRQLAYLRWSTRHNARAGRRVLADSKATRDDLVRLYDVDPAKIRVVYPGADPDMRREEDTDRIRAAGVRYGIRSPYLIYLGTLQPRKNLIRLVEAFAASELHTEGYTLVLAGKVGWLSQPLLDTISRFPSAVGGHIWVIGYVEESDKAPLLSGATALVYPSLYEGFGFPVLEAQACRTPVICAQTSSLPEAAGEGALLVDPLNTAEIAEAMRTLVTDDALQARLIEDGRANLERFNWEQTAAQTLEVLEGVMRRA